MKLLFVASLEDEPLPFVESRETPFDADADVNCRLSNDKSRSVYQSSASVPFTDVIRAKSDWGNRSDAP